MKRFIWVILGLLALGTPAMAGGIFDPSSTRFADVNGIRLAYVDLGPKTGVPVLMIKGLGSQMTYWDEDFVDRFLKRGYRVVLFDNRDVGLSSCLDGDGGNYAVTDMAVDVVGLLDHLGIRSAHIVGTSLGGMVAQRVAVLAPNRTRSLISIMSVSAMPDLAKDVPIEAIGGGGPDPAKDFKAALDHEVVLYRSYANNDALFDEAHARRIAARELKRNKCRTGVVRQFQAARLAPDVISDMAALKLPILVMHGDHDPLIPFASGKAMASAIPGAVFVPVTGMGHSIEPKQYDLVAGMIADFIDSAEKKN